ncbi:superinfection exclusion B family protein [Cyanobium sp. ATX 6A2]|uniref:super-infection exclusion protein B n=1 Tax=Cyanobium sp. ATX 6A2 TaxID=2823700 RepID=UPI0020CE7A4E|nr:super-infection exclusion protein B [Cyanobium sp. ATX 6A2]MCP9887330.1 superinfection exclusion B family protein [Cyanobium sp. ATX 6A2]
MDLTRFLELLKLRPQTLLGILLGTGVLALLPESALTKLGLHAFVSKFRGWLGGAFVLSSALLLGNGLSAVLRQVGRWISEINESKARRKSFKYLSPPEKALLAKYLNDKTTTHYFDISDGIANGLEARGFIYRASNVGAHYKSFAFNIQPWAWRCLQDNPRLVTDETITTEK